MSESVDANAGVQPCLTVDNNNTVHIPTVQDCTCIYVSENGLLQIPIQGDTDQNITHQLVTAENPTDIETTDREKKIMRVKRKKKSAMKNVYRLSTGQQISFVSDLLLSNTTNNVVENKETQEITVEKEKQLIYLCSQCAEQFLTVEQCREHMINVRINLNHCVFVEYHLSCVYRITSCAQLKLMTMKIKKMVTTKIHCTWPRTKTHGRRTRRSLRNS